LILIAIEAGATSANGLAAQQMATLNVTFLDCAANKDGASSPTVKVWNDVSGALVVNQTWPAQDYSAVRTGVVSLPEGFYRIAVANRACSDLLYVPVLQGHDRSIVAIARNAVNLDYNAGMITGSLPFQGFFASIVCVTSRKGQVETAALVEGNAYYATHLPSGDAKLRLYNSDRSRYLEFEIGKIQEGSTGNRDIPFSLSKDQVERAVAELGF
jgi:hypothetical protein